MTEFFEGLVGPGLATPVMWITAVAIIGVLLFLFSRIARRFVGGTFVAGGRGRRQRLAVLDATAVDSRRRLVLVRRDDVEHLILIGGPTDLVVEQDIRPPSESTEAQPRQKIVHVPEATVPLAEEETPRQRPQRIAPEPRPVAEVPEPAVSIPAERPAPRFPQSATARVQAARPPQQTGRGATSGASPVRPQPYPAQRTGTASTAGRPDASLRAAQTPMPPVEANETPAPSFSSLLDEERAEPATRVPPHDVSSRTVSPVPTVSVSPPTAVAPPAPPPIAVASAVAAPTPRVEPKIGEIPASVTSFVDKVSSARARTEPVLGAVAVASVTPNTTVAGRPDPVADADIDDALMRELEFSLDDEPTETDRKANGELDADMASLLDDLVGERR